MASSAAGRARQKPTVLLADNNAEFLRQQGEAFDSDGFNVLKAASPDEAVRLLHNPKVNLAIVDIRLSDDDDPKDVSGLHLAKSVAPEVPKIIVTMHPSWDTAREALRPEGSVSHSIVDYVDKQNGTEAIVAAARKALKLPALGGISAGPDAMLWFGGMLELLQQPQFALTFLVLAMGAGVAAVVTEDPSWLFGTIALTVLTVFLVGNSNR